MSIVWEFMHWFACNEMLLLVEVNPNTTRLMLSCLATHTHTHTRDRVQPHKSLFEFVWMMNHLIASLCCRITVSIDWLMSDGTGAPDMKPKRTHMLYTLVFVCIQRHWQICNFHKMEKISFLTSFWFTMPELCMRQIEICVLQSQYTQVQVAEWENGEREPATTYDRDKFVATKKPPLQSVTCFLCLLVRRRGSRTKKLCRPECVCICWSCRWSVDFVRMMFDLFPSHGVRHNAHPLTCTKTPIN